MTTAQRVIWVLGLALAAGCLAVPAHAQEDNEAPVVTHDEVKSARLGQAVRVRAVIEDAAGVFEPAVLYRVGGRGDFLRLPMSPGDGGDVYEATIPGDVVSDDLEYFIEAFDQRGNGPARYADADLPVKVPVLKTADPLPDPASATTAGGEDDGSGALWIVAGVAGAGLLLAAASTAGVIAFFLLRPAAGPSQVDVIVSGPTPIAAGAVP